MWVFWDKVSSYVAFDQKRLLQFHNVKSLKFHFRHCSMETLTLYGVDVGNNIEENFSIVFLMHMC